MKQLGQMPDIECYSGSDQVHHRRAFPKTKVVAVSGRVEAINTHTARPYLNKAYMQQVHDKSADKVTFA